MSENQQYPQDLAARFRAGTATVEANGDWTATIRRRVTHRRRARAGVSVAGTAAVAALAVSLLSLGSGPHAAGDAGGQRLVGLNAPLVSRTVSQAELPCMPHLLRLDASGSGAFLLRTSDPLQTSSEAVALKCPILQVGWISTLPDGVRHEKIAGTDVYFAEPKDGIRTSYIRSRAQTDGRRGWLWGATAASVDDRSCAAVLIAADRSVRFAQPPSRTVKSGGH